MLMEHSMYLVNQPLSQQGNKYEVFLSYSKGEDTQESFSSRLYSYLREDEISILKDVTSIELLQSIIEGSEISIIIFSKHYASSRRCLEELTKIMEFRRAYDQVVLPIFYGLDQSEVRNQESSFGEAFRGLIQRISPSEDEVSRWRTSLKEAGRNRGFVVPNFESKIHRDESEAIQKIVEHVRHILDRRGPFATDGLVGVRSRAQEVIKMLRKHECKDVVSLGIWGMGGIRKIALASVIFNHIQYEFETTCFLSNVRENWRRDGRVYLQKDLLSRICEETRMGILDSIESVSLDMKVRPCHKKLLLVLDDVDDLEQLEALCGNRKWFGQGSVIVITTRNSHLLRASGVDTIYRVKELSMHESLELFSREAFKQASPEREYIKLCSRMVSYSQGLPQTLKVLGSFLYGRSPEEWMSTLEKLRKYPHSDISNTLKLSFDSIDDNEKEIFLNIVLFYIGEDMNDVIQKLDDRGCHASIGMRGLVDKSVVTIDNNNKIRMCNVFQVMGRQIMRESSQNELLNRGHRYEVFLSFRGEDTQATFVSHLYSALCNAGIVVFKDDVGLPRGKHITTELLKAIGGSKILIIIFSKKYAGSKWCLEELSIIMELHKSNDQVVLPVFYDVDPSEIRKQTSSFGDAFRNLIQRISPPEYQVSEWKTTLNDAGSIAGIVALSSRDDSENVKIVVENVCDILDKKDLFVAEHPVGVGNRVQEVVTMLQNHQSEDVVMVGLWGMGGIGKTTIAKAIYNEIGHTFESRSYLSKIRKIWDQKRGLVHLQNQLLREICKPTKMKISSIQSGEITLRDRLCHKKALVVLDDVDKLAQLNALVGSPNWFKPGSIIIITTRNKRLLLQKDCLVYTMKNLDERESIELFSWQAFKQESPKEGFNELSRNIVSYSGGLPSALEVIGSFLFGRSPIEWESTLKKLRKYPPSDISNTLKPSFDSLDDNEREIFLNIVFFYIGEDVNVVIQKLDDGGCHASTGMEVLVDKSLVTIDSNNKLGVHDMLQPVGRQILRETSKKELQNQGRSYEVFLSFRGEDTRATFVSHLYSALLNAGITVFKDDVGLPRGKHIKIELLKAIGGSKISIIVFSKKYAGSKWCLEELSIIMELHKSNNQVVLPVFYDVDPSEIRNQTSSFGDAFKDLIQTSSLPSDQVSEWKRCLNDAGSIAGTVVLGSRDESENVKTIVDNVWDILDKKYLFVVEHPIGVRNRLEEVVTMLQNHQSEDVVMVGLCGIGGIGKTTIAKAIYNEIGHTFESRSFLFDIRIVWDQEGGQVKLQNQLLSEICKPTKMKISSIEAGKITLRDRLHHKKALVVLDDVDKLAQMNALVGSPYWFKPGSKIIITTRNKHLLLQKGCRVYEIKNLDERESIELFSWHAFKQESPKEGFDELSRNIVTYSRGIPLALEVLGSYLLGMEVKKWEKVLKKVKKIPNNEIQEKLKISFDGLDDLEKEIFLDISCFFIGMDINDVKRVLNGYKCFVDIGIDTLVERSLVTIDKNKLGMHDLLRDMGREIIRKQSPNELGKRSRIWFHKDARAVLLKDMGTEAIKGLSLKLSQSEKMQIETEAFKKMKSLRLLHFDNVQLRGDYEFISEDLVWLCWHGFTRKFIPSEFRLKKLVSLDLEWSSLTQVWKETEELEKLKILNLSHSHDLVQTPDFSKLPNLEKLILKDCPRLSSIHHSIGLLDKLLLLNLEDCIGLQSLPKSFYRLKCLETLILSGCMNIEKLEEEIKQMESLTTLISPTIKQVPFSLGRIKQQSLLLLEDGLETPDSLCGATNCMDISAPANCLRHVLIQIGKNSQVFCNLLEQVAQGLNLTKHSEDYILPGDNYPYWRTFKGEGASVKFKMPLVNGGDDLKGMTICWVYYPSGDLGNKPCESCIISLIIINYTKTIALLYTQEKLNSLDEEDRKEIISNLEPGDQVEVMIAVFGKAFTLKKTIVYLIYNESFNDYEHMEPSPSEATKLIGTKPKCEEEEEAHQFIKPKKESWERATQIATDPASSQSNNKNLFIQVAGGFDKKDRVFGLGGSANRMKATKRSSNYIGGVFADKHELKRVKALEQ